MSVALGARHRLAVGVAAGVSRMMRKAGPVLATMAALAAGAAAVPAGAAVPHGQPGAGLAGPKPPVLRGQLPAGPAPGGFAGWAPFYAMQARLDAAASAIAAADGAGTASITVDPERKDLTVYWPGRVPARLRALASGLGVAVRWAPAAFPLRTLVAQARRLAADPRVASAAPEPDGSGLAVTIPGTLARAGRTAVRQALRAAASVPLAITTAPRPRYMYSRQADVPWFWGGSAYWSAVGCTNGFAVILPGTSDTFMVSAGHCANTMGDDVVVPGQPDPTGTVWSYWACRDNLLIRYPAGVNGLIYTGGFHSQDGVSVSGATPDFVGDWVATGGSSSGEHFSVKVTMVDIYTSINNGLCPSIGPLIKAVSANGSCVVAPGDSGGPVYSIAADGTAIARGTITAGDNNGTSCPGLEPSGSNDVYYAPLLRPDGDPEVGYLQIYGFTVLTG